MKYFFITIVFSLSIQMSFSQNGQLWKGYFSYNEIKDITQSANRFFAASENALFSKSTVTNEIKTTNTIDGLSSQTISSVYHSVAFNKTLIGYKNGLLIVINEADGSIINIVDIIQKQLAPNIKKINHFNEKDGLVYISCDFGIVQFNLATLQFGDTYFIGSSLPEIIVNETAIFNGYIYAATQTEGIKRVLLTNPVLTDANQWIQVVSGNFLSATIFENGLFANGANGQIVRTTDGTAFSNFGAMQSPAAIDVRANNGFLIVTTPNNIFFYNQQLALNTVISNSQIPNTTVSFSCATILDNTIYIGTLENGVITTTITNPTVFEFLSPSGPSRNNIFSINISSSNLWATYGQYDEFYIPFVRSFGFSKYNQENGWTNFPFSAVDNSFDLVRVTVNPSNENQIFISSYFSGLLKFENDALITHYDETNSGLESLVLPSDPSYKSVRIEQSVFDKQGNLWMTNGLVANGLKVLKTDGQWQSYNMENIMDNFFDGRLGKMVIDKNGTKWIATISDGLIGFSERNNTNTFKKVTSVEPGNLPSSSVQALAIDNRNQIWIGTRRGLRVLSSVDRFFNDEPMTTSPIIILEDGLAQELLSGQFVTDIVVDGANNKWIATLGGGVFLFSPNGQETIHRFTSDNSPLPSNNINDIDINAVTGEIFFATESGMVSYQGTAIQASENLNNVVVYPNPVRPDYNGTVKITGLLNKANIKITDIEGNLVHEVISEGGAIEWDTTAFSKYKVASGVYMIFIAAQDGIEIKVKKVMIIR